MSQSTSDTVSPSGPDSGGALASLSPAKRALIEQRLRDRNKTRPASIPPRDPASPPVLSYAMRRLFVLDQALDDLIAYNVVQVLRLTGELDHGALHRALDRVVERHEILRTRITLTDAGDEVAVDPSGSADFAVMPAVESPGPELSEAARDAVDAAVREPFDLAAGQLLRARLIPLRDEIPSQYLLVLASHHIASDAVSKRIIAEELSEFYRAERRGEAAALEPLPLQYLDYAAWEASRPDAEDDLQWWRQTLSCAPEVTALPWDRSRPRVPTNRGATIVSVLDAELVESIGGFAKSQGATLFMTLLAGFAATLERYAGQGEIVVGSPTSGRHRDELRRMVGLFLNTLPIRIDTAKDPSFAEQVERVRAAATQAYRHQDVPFDKIVEAIRPHRQLGVNPIFQTMFTLREGHYEPPHLDGVEVSAVGFDGGWTKFDLGVTCFEVDGTVRMAWQYSTDLFDSTTVENLASMTTRLLRQAVAAPGTPLSELDLVSAEETRRRAAVNDTAAPFPDRTLPELIAEQVARTPDAPAVGDASGWLSYRELSEAAAALATQLRAAGVGADRPVAVCLNRGIGLEIALLAVLQAGGCYVPLDPGYPDERLQYMLSDSDAAVLITDGSLTGVPTATTAAHPYTVLLQPDRRTFAWQDGREPAVDVAVPATAEPVAMPENLAYVIYTSGTTGRPKGVMVEHRGIVNRLHWMQQQYQLTAADVVLQKTPTSFDVSVWELFWPMISGSRLFMADADGHRDPRYLTEVIERERVSVIHFVPSMLAAFLAELPPGAARSLRLVVTSGEALSDDLKELFFAALPHCELHNLYGPTEASVDVSFDRCLPGAAHPVTLGRPIANLNWHILDSHGRPVAADLPGELCLGGVGLARGYLNRRELTAEKFVSTEWGRLYRTGDQARWLPDDRVQYLGRLDGQVKLRGLRIELSEIESVLMSEPSVGQAVCVVTDDPSTGQRLDAYLIPTGDALDVQRVRDHARRFLPEFMVPNTITVVSEFPLGPSGKLDRSRLQPAVVAIAQPAGSRPLQGPTERRLAELWQRALGLPELPPSDASFFDLGGHSLMALTLFREIEKTFRVPLSLTLLFDNVTIERLASAIDAERGRTVEWDTLVPIRESGDGPPLFLMPELRGDVLTYRALLADLDQGRPLYGVQAPGLDGRGYPQTTIEALAASCREAMERVQPTGPYHLLGYCFGGVVAYEVARQLADDGQQVDFIGLIDAVPPRPRTRAEIRRAYYPAKQQRRTLKDVRGRLKGETERFFNRVQYFGTQAAIARGRMIPRIFVNVKQVNREALLQYTAPQSDLNLTVFCATGSAEDRRAAAIVNRWQQLTDGAVTLEPITSPDMDHYRVIRDHAGLTAQALNRYLAQHSS